MAQAQKPTINDVARAAGVSTATVSRCVNEPDRVLSATRDKVMKAVEQLGYTPDFGGRALASRRTNTVGAVIPTMENAIFARGVQSFQEVLSDAGVTLLVASSGYDEEQEMAQIKALIARGADGLLLIGTARPQTTYDFLRQRGVPYVLAWNMGKTDEHFVGFDNARAAADLTAKVIGLGHKRIAMIAGLTAMNDRAADRVQGVCDGMRLAGLDATALRVIEAPYTFQDGSEAFDQLMKSSQRPTAVICGNDVLAVGAISRAKELKLRVPEDVSITGFDDIDISTFVEPALTTVHVPHRRMGWAAAEQLLHLINGEPATSKVEIETEIIMRQSLGPVG
ncbi:MAG: LacI family DNA-binding transcriptional regulator [Alphaproteobacteria bacterium]|nr:LacI family DNA-binding transcriptional regulator [Alphaproteobacteria bacterium SS10]